MAATGSGIRRPACEGPGSRRMALASRLALSALLALSTLWLAGCGGAAPTGSQGTGPAGATLPLQVTAVVAADRKSSGFYTVASISSAMRSSGTIRDTTPAAAAAFGIP